jgi:5-methyltetrahydrofolate--homocysteine methyltransferase
MTVVEQLMAGGPVVTDGAWGTQLYARGLDPGDVPDSWNLSHPDRVEEVGRAYVEAGSQVILTNTLRANRVTLATYGLAEKTAEINHAGAAISRRAAAGRARVFASIGSSGRLLVMQEVSEEELFAAFREQAGALAEGGADALLIETMTDLAEACIAVRAARETGLPVAATMVFDSGKEKDRTMMGVTPERAAAELEAAGADVVGANCGVGIAGYVGVCRRMHAATSRPIWIKANAGLPEMVDGRTIYRMTAAEFAGYVPALLEAGASFLGGCCGTGPDFVRAIAAALGSRRTP